LFIFFFSCAGDVPELTGFRSGIGRGALSAMKKKLLPDFPFRALERSAQKGIVRVLRPLRYVGPVYTK